MFWTVTQALMSGLWTTFEIFILTLIFALPLGLIFAFGLLSRFKPVKAVMNVFVWVIRGTPLMLQLLVVRYGPFFLFKIKLSDAYDIYAVLIAFVINYAAYFAEIYRSGIESMPVGQYEAAQLLGFGKARTFIQIILPQVIKRVLPSVTNETITLVKDTSLAFAIGVIEMFTRAKQIAAAETSMLPYLFAGILYYIFNYAVAFGMEKAEKAFGYYEVK